ncbi:MAG TPA: hypothetical protein VM533_09905 [Fimbriiglobus sp.]|nr:hypothetical protein [Fimbriiglobus sp.]
MGALVALGVVLLVSPQAVASCGDHVLLPASRVDVLPPVPTPVPRPCLGPECTGRQIPATASIPVATPEHRGQTALWSQPTLNESGHASQRDPGEPDARSPAPYPDPIYHPPR